MLLWLNENDLKETFSWTAILLKNIENLKVNRRIEAMFFIFQKNKNLFQELALPLVKL